MGGKLVNEIRNASGVKVDIIFSPGIEQTDVVLKGPATSVEKAERMLLELLSSAKEINLTYEEKNALVTGGKECLMVKLQWRLQVPVSIQGRKLLLFGKSEETKKASEIIEEELSKI